MLGIISSPSVSGRVDSRCGRPEASSVLVLVGVFFPSGHGSRLLRTWLRLSGWMRQRVVSARHQAGVAFVPSLPGIALRAVESRVGVSRFLNRLTAMGARS